MKSFYLGDIEIKLPIIQGGMGVGISLSGLATAVANEGGIGVISCAGLGLVYRKSSENYSESCISGLKEELRKAKKNTKGIIGVNIMVALTNFADMVKTSITENVDVIFAGAGLPLDLPSYLTAESKTKLVPIVSSSRAAQIICSKWQNKYNYLPDAIVVEGPKAGGHLGFKKNQIDDELYSLENILPSVLHVTASYKKQKDIPVIVAGGIYSGKDIHRFIEMGASGVQMGTIFVTTDECDASMVFKKTYLDSVEKDLIIIESPVGMPGRAIDGEFIKNFKDGLEKPLTCAFHCIKTCDYLNSPYCIILALFNASKGNMKKGYAFAGSNAHLSTKIRSVKDVIFTLKTDFLAAQNESLKNFVDN